MVSFISHRKTAGLATRSEVETLVIAMDVSRGNITHMQRRQYF